MRSRLTAHIGRHREMRALQLAFNVFLVVPVHFSDCPNSMLEVMPMGRGAGVRRLELLALVHRSPVLALDMCSLISVVAVKHT